MAFEHKPVLLEECIEGLAIAPGGVYVDCTAGGGGHSYEIAKRLTTGRLICLDRDEEAIAVCRERLSAFGERVTICRTAFSELSSVLRELGIAGVDGVLMDLGVSSHQIDTPQRGFSFRADAPLDMRMDRRGALSAREIVNTYSEEALRDILWKYGEEKFSRQIAARIVREREKAPIETTGELSEIICSAMPAKARREEQHPAKRSFQAIRIAVNDELGELERTLDEIPALLNPGGRLVILTFHSLEDRIVKNFYREQSTGCICPPSFPVCVCHHKAALRLVNRRPIVADEGELQDNRRAGCAKLRIAERINDAEDQSETE